MFAAFNNWDQNHCGVTTSLAARPGRVPRALNRRAQLATRSRAGAATIQSREAFMIDKATYEIGYEIDNRPKWLIVPLRGILQLLQETPSVNSPSS